MTTRRNSNLKPKNNQELEHLQAENNLLAEENKRLKIRLLELTTNKGDAASQAEKAKNWEHEEKQQKVTNTKPQTIQ